MKRYFDELCNCGAVWQHSNEFSAPHIALRNGKHSRIFINLTPYFSEPAHLKEAASHLMQELIFALGDDTSIDWVFGSPIVGVDFVKMLASVIEAKNVGFLEKGDDGRLICSQEIEVKKRVLFVVEMTTTGATPQLGIDAIRIRNPEAVILPYVGAYLIRCNKKPEELRDATLVPVVDLPSLGLELGEWEEGKCPLCENGSLLIEGDPKDFWDYLLESEENPALTFPESELLE